MVICKFRNFSTQINEGAVVSWGTTTLSLHKPFFSVYLDGSVGNAYILLDGNNESVLGAKLAKRDNAERPALRTLRPWNGGPNESHYLHIYLLSAYQGPTKGAAAERSAQKLSLLPAISSQAPARVTAVAGDDFK